MSSSPRGRWLAGLLAPAIALGALAAAPPAPAAASSTDLPAACSAGTTVLSEDFSDGAIPAGWHAKAGTWSVSEGALTGTGAASAANPTRIVTDLPHLDRYCLDFTMRFSAATATNRWAGAILDLDPAVAGGPWQHGMMRLDGNVAFGTRTAANTGWGTDIAGTTQTALALEQDVRVTMVVDGSYGELWYSPNFDRDRVRIASTNALKRTATGSIGFLLDGATVSYDNITVVELPARGALALSAPAEQRATAGAPNNAWTPAVVGGTPTFTWSATGLPRGLAINTTTGAITGTPTTPGDYASTITVTDAKKATASAAVAYTVAPKLVMSKPENRAATVGSEIYQYRIPAETSGGDGLESWSATKLPAGLEITPNGTVSGTPTVAGTSTVTLIVTDRNGATATNTFTYTVSSAFTVSTPPTATATAGIPITPWKLTAAGGKAPYEWWSTGWPKGVSMDRATGLISGTPTTAESTPVMVIVSDANHATKTIDFTYIVTELVCIPADRIPAPGDTGSVIAHRGNDGASGFGENTLGAIANAVAKGADAFEIDVQLTTDNVPVVRHNLINNMSLAQFRGNYKDLPTLAEVAQWMQTNDARMVLEYKGKWSVAGTRIVADLLNQYGVQSRTVSQSFDLPTLDNVHAVDPAMPIVLLVEGNGGVTPPLIQTAQSHHLSGINPNVMPTAEIMKSAHAAGLSVSVWTKNSASEWAAATAAGVDGIITDNTSALVKWYADYNVPRGLKSCKN